MTKLPHIEDEEPNVSLQHGTVISCAAGAVLFSNVPVAEAVCMCLVCMDRIWEIGENPIKSINPNAIRRNHKFGVFPSMT
ncbi:MAG: hypothetical protein Q8L41_13365 [Anaerolineales bacterium]|nr:hypothetical protein [Anaerolineales bacterium]